LAEVGIFQLQTPSPGQKSTSQKLKMQPIFNIILTCISNKAENGNSGSISE